MGRLGIPLEGAVLHGHPLPVYRVQRWPFWGRAARRATGDGPQARLATRRWLLVGDAAGLVDPLLGQGIRYALASGRLVAEAIARDDLTGYDRAVWRAVGHSLATGGEVARLFYAAPRLSFALGLRNPAGGAAICRPACRPVEPCRHRPAHLLQDADPWLASRAGARIARKKEATWQKSVTFGMWKPSRRCRG